ATPSSSINLVRGVAANSESAWYTGIETGRAGSSQSLAARTQLTLAKRTARGSLSNPVIASDRTVRALGDSNVMPLDTSRALVCLTVSTTMAPEPQHMSTNMGSC